MKKLLALLLILLLSIGSLSGCDAKDVPDSSATEQAPIAEELTTDEKIDLLWEQLDTRRLPQREGYFDYRTPFDELNKLMIPIQVNYPDDETAEMLADKLRYYTGYRGGDGNGIGNYALPLTNINDREIIAAMLACTVPLDCVIKSSGDDFIKMELNNHVVSVSLQQYVKDGKMICDVYGKDDIEDSLRYFFGDQVKPDKIRHSDIGYDYDYLKRGGIYVRKVDFGGPAFAYPMLVSYSETDTGYICDAVIVWALDRETPTTVYNKVGDDWQSFDVTRENFAEVTKNKTMRRYTLDGADDGRLILTSLQTVRQGENNLS